MKKTEKDRLLKQRLGRAAAQEKKLEKDKQQPGQKQQKSNNKRKSSKQAAAASVKKGKLSTSDNNSKAKANFKNNCDENWSDGDSEALSFFHDDNFCENERNRRMFPEAVAIAEMSDSDSDEDAPGISLAEEVNPNDTMPIDVPEEADGDEENLHALSFQFTAAADNPFPFRIGSEHDPINGRPRLYDIAESCNEHTMDDTLKLANRAIITNLNHKDVTTVADCKAEIDVLREWKHTYNEPFPIQLIISVSVVLDKAPPIIQDETESVNQRGSGKQVSVFMRWCFTIVVHRLTHVLFVRSRIRQSHG